MRSLLVLVLLCLMARPGTAQSSATYQVTFESTWSAATHPDGFPGNPHFSGLVGATHTDAASLWMPGELASPGMESMAETGSKSLLLAEVDGLIGGGEAEFALSGPGMTVSPGEVTYTFTVNETHSLVSLVTMLAPSPDWFVGVHGLDLHATETWTPLHIVPLYVYDAGTDSGTTYTAPNQNTQPQALIAEIEGPPFNIGGSVPPIGSFTFTLLSTTSNETLPSGSALSLEAPSPNPVRGQTALRLHLASAQEVTVEVFDTLGRRVATLRDGVLASGVHRLTMDTQALVPGVYIVRAQTQDGRSVQQRIVRQ